jgi:hypothetical protein
MRARRLVDEFLQKNPRAQFHFTPTYSSWLNQVELWFGKIERDIIARGVFTDLARKIKRYITAIRQMPNPFSGSTQIQNAASVVTNSLRQATVGVKVLERVCGHGGQDGAWCESNYHVPGRLATAFN